MAEYLSGFKHVLPHLSVIAPLRSTGKDDAINELFREVSLLDNLNRIHNLKDAVLRREMEGNTGIGHGVAVAHGKLTSLTDMYLFLGISRSGIAYGSYDSEPVHMLFVAANPPAMQTVYLDVLSRLTRYLKNPAIRERLIQCESHIIREILRAAMGCSPDLYRQTA